MDSKYRMIFKPACRLTAGRQVRQEHDWHDNKKSCESCTSCLKKSHRRWLIYTFFKSKETIKQGMVKEQSDLNTAAGM